MNRHIDFYFDFTSPYAYLAAARIDALAARYEREVRWHPVLLAALSEATGNKLAPFIPSKWSYVQKDLVRAAKRLDLPFQLPPAFPQLWLNPPRAMLWIREHHGEEVARAFARSCFKAAFGHGTNIGSIDVVADLAARVGVDADALREGVNQPAIKDALKAGIEAALANGVFGVPYVVVDDETFWGGDRLECVEDVLAAAQTAA